LQALSHYDYIIIGAGLAGCVAARELADRGAECLVVDRRQHIGGNCYSYYVGDIEVHKYGPHIFHTDDKNIWDYINRFANWRTYYHQVKSFSEGELYDFPINKKTIEKVCPDGRDTIKLYDKFYSGYTKKAWFGEKPPFDVLKYIPVKTTDDNNYWADKYQGLPDGGYINFFKNLLFSTRIKTVLGTEIDGDDLLGNRLIYSGRVDNFYGFLYGILDYRGCRFETKQYQKKVMQGYASINYADERVPYLRTMEWKYFDNIKSDYTIVTTEFATKDGDDYPYETEENIAIYENYKRHLSNYDITLIGRHGLYKYMNMDETIKSTLDIIKDVK